MGYSKAVIWRALCKVKLVTWRKTNTVWSDLNVESEKSKLIETADGWLPEAVRWGKWVKAVKEYQILVTR